METFTSRSVEFPMRNSAAAPRKTSIAIALHKGVTQDPRCYRLKDYPHHNWNLLPAYRLVYKEPKFIQSCKSSTDTYGNAVSLAATIGMSAADAEGDAHSLSSPAPMGRNRAKKRAKEPERRKRKDDRFIAKTERQKELLDTQRELLKSIKQMNATGAQRAACLKQSTATKEMATDLLRINATFNMFADDPTEDGIRCRELAKKEMLELMERRAREREMRPVDEGTDFVDEGVDFVEQGEDGDEQISISKNDTSLTSEVSSENRSQSTINIAGTDKGSGSRRKDLPCRRITFESSKKCVASEVHGNGGNDIGGDKGSIESDSDDSEIDDTGFKRLRRTESTMKGTAADDEQKNPTEQPVITEIVHEGTIEYVPFAQTWSDVPIEEPPVAVCKPVCAVPPDVQKPAPAVPVTLAKAETKETWNRPFQRNVPVSTSLQMLSDVAMTSMPTFPTWSQYHESMETFGDLAGAYLRKETERRQRDERERHFRR